MNITASILEHLWVLFIGLGSWALNRITSKIDILEKGKADAQDTKLEHANIATLVHELDRRVDENQHLSVGRGNTKQMLLQFIGVLTIWRKTKQIR